MVTIKGLHCRVYLDQNFSVRHKEVGCSPLQSGQHYISEVILLVLLRGILSGTGHHEHYWPWKGMGNTHSI